MTFDIATGAVIEDAFYEYAGPIDLLCGATAGQTTALNQQTGITNQVMQQGQSVFGSDSQVFNDLTSSLAPTVAAGPSQKGFSAAETSNLNSQAITQNGAAYQNAKSATGDAMSSVGGGNTSTSSGATAGVDANLASSAASNTANQLGQIQQADYQQGNQNYNTAVSGLAGATGVFNSANSAADAESGAASGEANTANQIATQNNSWMQAASGALGGVLGAATGGIIKNMGSGSSGSSGSSGCWIAAELYGGWDNQRVIDVREWLFGPFRETWFGYKVTQLYIRYGERCATFIRKHRWSRKAFRIVFDMALDKARKWEKK